ncbi:MAG TPA: phage portal protein [Patescibacteria group bacterium]|nr:phage portal protein [Patescibacteria group bacterium]
MDTKEIQRKTEENRTELKQSFNKKGLSDRVIEPDEPLGFQGVGYTFGDEPPKLKEGDYLKSSIGWVYAAVSAIADAIMNNKPELYKVSPDGEIIEVPQHPALDLLYKVNSFQSFLEFINLTAQYLELTGEAPWFVDRGNGKTPGEPQNLMLLRPDKLIIEKSANATDASMITGYKYKLDNGQTITISKDELILLKYPDPTNPFRGKGTLQAAAVTFDVDSYSEEYNKRFFYNGARPDSILSTDQRLSKTQRQTLRAELDRMHKGYKNANKAMILEAGLKMAPYAMTANDMQFMEQMKFSRDKILSIFRVPKSIVAITEDVNLANAEVSETVFNKHTIAPKLERIAAQLNEFYLPLFAGTENMFICFEDPVDEDREDDLKLYDNALKNGWMTINEVRADQNLPDVGPEGDVLLVPQSLVPIDQAGQNPLPPLQLPPPKSITLRKTNIRKQKIIARSKFGYYKALRMAGKKVQVKKLVEKLDGKIQKIAKAAVIDMIKKKKLQKKIAEKEWETIKSNFVRRTMTFEDQYISYFTKTTQLIFRAQAKKILDKFPKSKAIKAQINPDDYQLDPDEETQIMINIYDPIIRQLIKDQGRRASGLVTGKMTFDMATRAVQDYLKSRGYDFSFEINEETNKQLGQTLSEGIAAGEGIPQLRTRVVDTFNDMEKHRADRIARSEVIRASNFATTQAYKQSGVVNKVQWLATEDDAICEWCAPMDGTVIDLGDSFFQDGDTFTGKNGGKLDLNYGDVDFPPLHPNCRCTTIPIIN